MLRRNSLAFFIALLFVSIQILGCGSGSKTVMLTLTGTVPATGAVDAGYLTTLTVSGGTSPYTWTVTGLPAGVMASGLMTPTLTISGTPTTAGTSTVVVTVSDSKGNMASSTTSVMISGPNGTLAITPATLGTLTNGTAVTPIALTATETTGPYTWTVSSGSLPVGLMLNNGTTMNATTITSTTNSITITGTPTGTGAYSFTLSITDSAVPTVGSGSQAYSGSVSAAASAACAPRGNESALTASAPFAFLVKGLDSDDNPIVIAGSFTPHADGTITAASADYNGFTTGFAQLSVNLTASSYSFGSDSRGCLSIAVSPVQAAVKPAGKASSVPHFKKMYPRRNSAAAVLAAPPATITFSFVLAEKTGNGFQSGRIIEFDQTATGGSATAGMMHVQTPASFTQSLQSNYAFGVDGWDPSFNRLAVAGTFINTSGVLSGGVGDYNDQGLVPPVSGELDGGSGTISTTVDASTGRGTGTISLPLGGNTFLGFDFAFYVINGSDFYVISTDLPSDVANSSGLLSGQALATQASFTPGSLSGSYLLAGSGFDAAAFNEVGSGNVAEIGNFQATNTGAIMGGNIYVNDAGNFATTAISGGAYLTQTSGRTTITATGSGAPIGYLTAPSSDENVVAFFVGTDTFTTSGTGYLQTTTTPAFSATSLNSPFVMGSDEDVDGSNGSINGVFTFGGASKTYSAVADVAFLGSAPAAGQAMNGGFAVNADGSGMVTFAGNSATWQILTNGTQIFAIDVTGSDGGLIDPLLYVFTIENKLN